MEYEWPAYHASNLCNVQSRLNTHFLGSYSQDLFSPLLVWRTDIYLAIQPSGPHQSRVLNSV